MENLWRLALVPGGGGTGRSWPGPSCNGRLHSCWLQPGPACKYWFRHTTTPPTASTSTGMAQEAIDGKCVTSLTIYRLACEY